MTAARDRPNYFSSLTGPRLSGVVQPAIDLAELESEGQLEFSETNTVASTHKMSPYRPTPIQPES